MITRDTFKTAFPIVARRTGAACALARRYGGRGTIFMLHSVVDDARSYPDQGLRCPAERLAAILRWLANDGVAFVSLDEAIARLGAPSGRRFAAFTFDDGYADTLTRALPVMERFGAPFTVYVTTGMMTGEIDAWWLGLAALIRRRDRVEVPGIGWFDCPDSAGKQRAYAAIERLVHQDFATLDRVRAAIAAGGIDCGALAKAEALNVHGLRQLAGHTLATIGAHGTTHLNLARASAAVVRHEMSANRGFLEDHIDRPVVHFAYPFGHAGACGAREAEIAGASGFRTAVTTRRGSLFPQHLAHLHALPREPLTGEDTPSSVRCKVGGVYRALHSRLGDPIALM